MAKSSLKLFLLKRCLGIIFFFSGYKIAHNKFRFICYWHRCWERKTIAWSFSFSSREWWRDKKKKKHPIIVYFEVPFVMLFVNEMGDDEVDV